MKPSFLPCYRCPKTGYWLPTNLGRFPSASEAEEAVSHWALGYRSAHPRGRTPETKIHRETGSDPTTPTP